MLVEAKGFKKAVLDKVKVDTAVTVPANITLETGSISEQVVVTAEASMINTESGTTSQTITTRQLQDVPLNNRSVLDLALTAPNVVGDAGSEDPGVSARSAGARIQLEFERRSRRQYLDTCRRCEQYGHRHRARDRQFYS